MRVVLVHVLSTHCQKAPRVLHFSAFHYNCNECCLSAAQENITVEPTTFNFTSSATTHNFTITALKDFVVEEDQRVVLSATTDAMNVAIQSNMPTVIVEDRTSEYMACIYTVDST